MSERVRVRFRDVFREIEGDLKRSIAKGINEVDPNADTSEMVRQIMKRIDWDLSGRDINLRGKVR